jgi:uncharacterized membrane protein YdjX (TVP38/TMEM64 family)
MSSPSQNKVLARYAPIALIAAGLALALALRLHERLSLDALYAQGEALDAFVASNFLAALALSLLIYAAVVTISLPGAGILTMACGFLFGTWFGGTVAWIGASIGATLIFLAARTAFGDALRARAGSWIERLASGFRENAFNYLLVLRLTPVAPFFIVNVAPAVLNVNLRDYVLATAIGIVPATFVYAAVGAGLRKALEAGGQSADPATLARTLISSPAILGPIVGLIVLALIPVAVKALRAKRAGTQA